MPIPAVALGLMLGSAAVGAGANLYSQKKQRDLYRYQRGGYERQWNDYKRRLGNREIRYPEFSFPGRIRALDTGISQSYAASIGTESHLLGSVVGGASYGSRAGRSLYGRSSGRSSRYL